MGAFFDRLEARMPTYLVIFRTGEQILRACLVEARDPVEADEKAIPLRPRDAEKLTSMCLLWPGEAVPVGFLNRPLSEIEWRAIIDRASEIVESMDKVVGSE